MQPRIFRAGAGVSAMDDLVPVPPVIRRRAWECARDIAERGAASPFLMVACAVLARHDPDTAPVTWWVARGLFRQHRLIFGTRV